MKTNIKGNVSWVGKVDWELQNFHGNEYSTHKGSTYNIVSPFVNTVFYKSSVDFLLFFKLITYQLGHFYL